MNLDDLLKQAGITEKEIDAIVKHVESDVCFVCIQDLIRIQSAFDRILRHVAETAGC